MKKILILALGVASVSAMSQTFSGGAGFAIPDNNGTGAGSTISVGNIGYITSLNSVSFTVTTAHTWVGDLIVQFKNLTTGTSVHLMSRLGSTTATGVGSAGVLQTGTFSFVDGGGAAQPLTGAMAAGTYNRKTHAFGAGAGNSGVGVPQFNANTYAAFAGQNLGGNYELRAWDNASGDIGTIGSWEFNVSSAVPEPATMAALGLGVAALLRRRKK
ncbi:MAG: PEP-CTERM sorting domain-containing protein [Fimbriimonadaceae bacterium]